MDVRSNITAWRLLTAIGEQSGLARAAESLDLDPGRASRLIHSLESALECELLARNERPLGLTDEARALLPAAIEYIRAHDALVAATKAAAPKIELLKIGVPVNIARKEILEVLDLPHLRNAVETVRIVPEADLDDLREKRIDLAILPHTPKDEDLEALPICETCTCGLAAPEYIARHGAPRSPEALAEHPLILRRGGSYPEAQVLVRGSESFPLLFSRVAYAGDLSTCKELTLLGQGICFDLSLGVTYNDILAGKLVAVLPQWHRPKWRLSCSLLLSRKRERRLFSFARNLALALRKPLDERTRRWYAGIGVPYED